MRAQSTSLEVDAFSKLKRSDFEYMRGLAVLLPALYVGLFEFFRHQWLEPIEPTWLATGWMGNIIAAFVVGIVVYIFVRFFANALQKSASELTRAREEAAVIVERQRIARQMHDTIAQTLFYLTVEMREVEELVLAERKEEAYNELETAREEIRAAHHKVRAVIADLREQAELENFGDAVRRTATELAQRLGMTVTCEVAGHVNLPLSSQQHVLAIIQEALINAQRHSHIQQATVRLITNGGDAIAEVSDEGVGFDSATIEREGRYGLTIMEERAQMAGGELSLVSTPARGTRVTVLLPGAAS